MSDRWRCFVAVPVPDRLRDSLAAAVDRWRVEADGPNLRWTDAEGWHVTLAFLGWIDSADVPALGAALREPAARAEASVLAAGELGAFPSRRRARVVWYGIADVEGVLARLADRVRKALNPIVPSLAHESPFRAHLTLARARDDGGVDLSDWLVAHRPPAGELAIHSVVLYRSHLGRGPARYEELLRVPVGAPAAAGAMSHV